MRDSPLIARTQTQPLYELIDLGPYPALIEGGETAVSGEVFDVDESLLPLLDEYEDCPELYRRLPVRLCGEWVAQAYVMPRESLKPEFRAIPSGDWRRR